MRVRQINAAFVYMLVPLYVRHMTKKKEKKHWFAVEGFLGRVRLLDKVVVDGSVWPLHPVSDRFYLTCSQSVDGFGKYFFPSTWKKSLRRVD